MENWVVIPKLDRSTHESLKCFLVGLQVPINPTDFIVLTVGVVVAALGSAELIARQQHRDSLREEQRHQEIAPLSFTKLIDPFIRSVALETAIPTAVVVVAAVFKIRLIVFLVVADQVFQCEPVVRRDKVNACQLQPETQSSES